MNTERLLAVAIAAIEEYDKLDAVAVLQRVKEAPVDYDNSDEPDALATLLQMCERLESGVFARARPSEVHIVRELRIDNQVGRRLSARLRTLHQIYDTSPTTTREGVAGIINEIEAVRNRLLGLVHALELNNVSAYRLQPGDAEIGFRFPAPLHDSEALSLASRLHDAQRCLSVLTEISEGVSRPIRVKQISSSDWEVFIQASPATAVIMAFAIDKITQMYERVLSVRKLKNDLDKAGIDSAASQLVEIKVEEIVRSTLDALRSEIMNRSAQTDAARRNELENGLRHTLGRFSDMLDHGVDMEAAIGPPDVREPKPGSPDYRSDNDKLRLAQYESVQRGGAAVSRLRREEMPVLRLSEYSGGSCNDPSDTDEA